MTPRLIRRIQRRNEIPNLLHALNARRICEVGVRDGEHLRELLVCDVSEVVAVDMWRETGNRAENDECFAQQELDRQCKRVAGLDTRVRVDRCSSVVASAHYPDGHFDFVYLDADHTEAAVNADIRAWWPKVRAGGVLAGHDYCAVSPTCPDGTRIKFGVVEAVNRFVATNGLCLHVDLECDWFVAKPAVVIPMLLTNRPGRPTMAACRAAQGNPRP